MRTSGLWIHKDEPEVIYVANYIYKQPTVDELERRILILIHPHSKQQLRLTGWQDAKAKGFKKI